MLNHFWCTCETSIRLYVCHTSIEKNSKMKLSGQPNEKTMSLIRQDMYTERVKMNKLQKNPKIIILYYDYIGTHNDQEYQDSTLLSSRRNILLSCLISPMFIQMITVFFKIWRNITFQNICYIQWSYSFVIKAVCIKYSSENYKAWKLTKGIVSVFKKFTI